jgi:hypothetical protein
MIYFCRVVPIRPFKHHTAKYEAPAPRQLAFRHRHSLPVRPAADAGVRTQSTPNGEHQESVLESETGPTLAPAPVAPARAAPPCRLALVLHRHATDRAGEHESGSTPRIRGDGLIPAAAATEGHRDMTSEASTNTVNPLFDLRCGGAECGVERCA